jgi:hypothetical protein
MYSTVPGKKTLNENIYFLLYVHEHKITHGTPSDICDE